MRFWVYIALGVALLALASYRQVIIGEAAPADRNRCEMLVATNYAAPPETMARLQAACRHPGMVAMMDARGMGASPQSADQVLAAVERHGVLSVLINLALVGAGIASFCAARRQRRVLPYRR